MRDAFGGIFMIRLMLVFVFIFVAFTAISLNYAKAFRIKNKVIDFVEQEEIMDLDSAFNSANGSNLEKLDRILDDAKYNKECQNVESNGKISIFFWDYRNIVPFCFWLLLWSFMIGKNKHIRKKSIIESKYLTRK